mmetsp:Transcript_22295/g.56933  ORF Transcript_22295/g.56933 Transcript_22295/m.56933 type:complete len:225 (+) Transcript_22295:522-1196(+)
MENLTAKAKSGTKVKALGRTCRTWSSRENLTISCRRIRRFRCQAELRKPEEAAQTAVVRAALVLQMVVELISVQRRVRDRVPRLNALLRIPPSHTLRSSDGQRGRGAADDATRTSGLIWAIQMARSTAVLAVHMKTMDMPGTSTWATVATKLTKYLAMAAKGAATRFANGAVVTTPTPARPRHRHHQCLQMLLPPLPPLSQVPREIEECTQDDKGHGICSDSNQ